MTKEQFRDKMLEISKRQDPEEAHHEADQLMVQALAELGYQDGLEFYDVMEKWYS